MFVTLVHFFAFMLNVNNVLYVIVYVGCLMICGVCYVWRNRLYVKGVRPRPFTCGKGGELKRINQRVKGVRPRPLTCGKGGELKRINHELRVFDLGRLHVVRVGNLNELTTS